MTGGCPIMGIEKERIEETVEPCSSPSRTSLGKRLLEIRAKILASGAHLLDWDEIEQEVAERRGGLENGTR
jgi:hypothetical protein